MILEEIRSEDGTGTLSYLVVDETTRASLLIDPNLSDLLALNATVERLGGRLQYIIDTHTHADHTSAAGELHKRLGAPVLMHENTVHKWKVVDQGDQFGIGDILRANAAIEVQRYLSEGEIVPVGSLQVRIFHTPGHTDNHISPLIEGHLFTGDLLLFGQAGRSDLPGGDPGQQYDSLFKTILSLPDTTWIHPGHDYEGNGGEDSTGGKGREPVPGPTFQGGIPRVRRGFLSSALRGHRAWRIDAAVWNPTRPFSGCLIQEHYTRRTFAEAERRTGSTPSRCPRAFRTHCLRSDPRSGEYPGWSAHEPHAGVNAGPGDRRGVPERQSIA